MSLISIKNTSQPQGEVGEINLVMLLGVLLDHYKFIVVFTAVFTFIAMLYAFNATPIYQANALIQIEQKQGNTLLSNISQMLPDSQPQSAPEITLLRSRMILGKTVDTLALHTTTQPYYLPVIGRLMAKLRDQRPGKIGLTQLSLPAHDNESATATLRVINHNQYHLSGENFELEGRTGERVEKYGVSLLVTEINAEPGSQFTVTQTSRLKAITLLQERFNVAEVGKDTGMLNLIMAGEDPQLINTTLQTIAEHYLAQNITRQAEQDEKSLQFLNTQLPAIRNDLNRAEDKLNAYRKQKDSVDLNMEAKSALDQIVNIENQLNELTFREAEISQRYKKEHPTYRALMEKRDTLQNERAKMNKRVSAMPSTQQEVLRLSRDVDSGRAVYLQLLSRQQELNVAKSSAIGNVRIIDDAITVTEPIKPKKIIIIMTGFILGGFISVALVLLQSALRQGLESPEQLEERDINVYASVPYSEWLRKKDIKSRKGTASLLLAEKNPADQAIETLRGLRTSLYFSMMEAKNNVLMISGVSLGAGKTFISSNLAAVIAQTKKKVLLIDADMRKGYLHEVFGLEAGCGLAEILKGTTPFEQAVVSLPDIGLDYLSRGHIPSHPAELLMSPAFKALLDTASSRYDLIIIDTPPVMAVTDATIVGRHAETIVMVARFEENTVKEVEVCIRRFKQNGMAINGWILNGVKKRKSSDYGYGYSAYGTSYSQKQA
ncbi:polysaccharide biosynthesis tyrosine autokinase [Scandinavium goeteborgense]|uniref:polysaccharide biosynthesis tyrosine autokinase n=1 Tax=Scandinavium goeteborgense TaxID=1851514 RepID=UPI0021650C8D|nr:polysaccharide biosynthesis tyrosine autokinase [Scandinavium goeteborgense]MCS2151548.1 polysaccharide biosynthesis tyrosine autokinase [Scandinavium goeteborgense]